MIEIELFGGLGHVDLVRTRGAFGSSPCSPMAGTAPYACLSSRKIGAGAE